MENIRTLTQADVNKMVDTEVVVYWQGLVARDEWNIIASDVYNMVQRMRRHGTIDEVYGLEEMIDNAIKNYI